MQNLFETRSPLHRGFNAALTIQILFCCIVALTIGMVIGLIWLHRFWPPFDQPIVGVLIESVRPHILPEPTERFVFVVLAVIVPVIALFSTLASTTMWASNGLKKIPRNADLSVLTPLFVPTLLLVAFSGSEFLARISDGYKGARLVDWLVLLCIFIVSMAAARSKKMSDFMKKHTSRTDPSAFLPIVVSILLFAPFLRSDFLALVMGEEVRASTSGDIKLLICLGLASILCLCAILNFRFLIFKKRTSHFVIWTLFVVSALLQLCSWRLVDVNAITVAFKWSGHADPLFYVLSQVVNGKTLLVDLPSQYGLWVELIAPIFRMSAVSVINVTGFFAVLQLASSLVLFFVLFKLIKDPLLLVLGGIALIVMTFGTNSLFSGARDPYFQYWPIRSFWPMLSVFAVYKFTQRATLVRCVFVSAMGALSLFWNTDTGLFVVIAFGSMLFFKFMVSTLSRNPPGHMGGKAWTPKRLLLYLIVHAATTLFVLAVLFALLTLKSGKELDFSWLVEYQRIFFGLGFFMLPLPRDMHPWMPVLGIYLLGLLVSVHSWVSPSQGRRADTVFYLSMLGIGLFAYYQGRSHVLNLITVCWPAVLVGLILTDESLRAMRTGLLPKNQLVLPIIFATFLFVCCLSFIANGEKMLFGVVNLVTTHGIEHSPLVQNELSFIKEQASQKRECLILSRRQGIYHAESGLVSPFRGPGLVEMVLKSDQDRLITDVKNGGAKCLFFGLGRHTGPDLPLDLHALQDQYSVVAINSLNTMVYLEPKLP